MKLEKIKGNTYYIDAPTNIGVYVFKNKNCLLIDTGINNSQAKKIDEVLIENGLHPKYIINTHAHLDHCGGNHYFKSNYPGCIVYASAAEKLYMENPELYFALLFSSNPVKGLEPTNRVLNVDFDVENGINKINDEKFELISLGGHSPGQIGVITPEKVCFAGDSIFSEGTIEKYLFPYLLDIRESIKTLDELKSVDADCFVIGHSNRIYEKEQFDALIEKNLSNIDIYRNQILELLDQPLTREEILENITVLNELELNFKQYFRNFSTVSAFIKYLDDAGLIDYSVENGKLYYFKKPV